MKIVYFQYTVGNNFQISGFMTSLKQILLSRRHHSPDGVGELNEQIIQVSKFKASSPCYIVATGAKLNSSVF